MAGDDLRKAAIFIMSLPKDQAGRILGKLEPKQVEMVATAIARLDGVSGGEQEQVIEEFVKSNPNKLSTKSGGLELAKDLIQDALGTNAGEVLENVTSSIEAVPFSFLQKVDSQNLLTFLIDEHPQTIALIISHLPPQQAADIISGLPVSRRISVVRRVATMGQTNPDIVHAVEAGLQRRMSSVMSQHFEKAGGVQSVAAMLNVIDRATERALLENLAQDEPDLVEEIRRLMFVFEDIGKLADGDIQILLKSVDQGKLALALKSASDDLREKIMHNMSTRASETLKEEMDYLGTVRLSSVEQSQQQIVDVVRQLEDRGEITVSSSGDEQFVQ